MTRMLVISGQMLGVVWEVVVIYSRRHPFELQKGLPCVWMDARDVLVVTPTSKQHVDPDYEASEVKLYKWYQRFPSDTIIATGFIASTPENIPTTLKRDGSDLSAAIMGALFQAAKVTIWTDVDGVYSADPRKGNFRG